MKCRRNGGGDVERPGVLESSFCCAIVMARCEHRKPTSVKESPNVV